MPDDFSNVTMPAQNDPGTDNGDFDGAAGIAAPEGGEAPAASGTADVQKGKAHVPNLRDVLRDSGVDLPDDVIDRLDKTYVHKGALQPKREAEKQRLDQMEAVVRQLAQENRALMARVAGTTGGAPQPPKTPLQEYLEEIEADPENKGLSEFMGKFANALKQDVLRQVDGYVAPALQQATHTKQEQVLDQYLEQLVPVYGDGVRQMWPRVKQVYREYLQQGVNMLPENILWGVPELAQQMRQLVVQGQQTSRQAGLRRQTGISMEGFAGNTGEVPDFQTDEGMNRRNPNEDMGSSAILRRVSRMLSNRSGQPFTVSG